MKESKKIIGRGLADLLEEHHVDDVLQGESIHEIDLSLIKPNPFQPRRLFDQEKIDELAQSIEIHGVFQPIILKKTIDGYMIVSGERRYRASKQVGLSTIPAIVRQYEEEKVAEIALIENLQREDLSPIEEAEAYYVMVNKLNLTHEQLSNKIGKSRSHVTNMLGLLKLPEDIQQKVLTKELTMGHARALSKINDKELIRKMADDIIKKGLNVRETEYLIRGDKPPKKRKTNKMVFEKEALKLSKQIGAKVIIKGREVIIRAEKDSDVQHLLAALINLSS